MRGERLLETVEHSSGDALTIRVGGFDYEPRTRVLFGPGTIARLGELAAELGGRRVLIVSDTHLV